MSGLSVATIKSPEFINITSVSPLISKCEVKVLYLGENRNRSYITKEVATNMAQTLPGTPIVGYYSENKEDFGDHGEQMIIDGDGLRFNCLTKPYGFVPTDTKIWFKEFEDTDEFGNKVLREYLMCEGYLWTEQYKEAQSVINEGRPHSMELDEKTLKGHWSTDNNRGIEFFIINDAIFSKLCILGEDVEPCFEGSSVTAPEVSSSFTLKADEFTSTLFSMMKELKELTFSLKEQGGNSMATLNNDVQAPENTAPATPEFTENPAPEAEAAAPAEENANANENFSAEQGTNEQQVSTENQNNVEEFKKNEEDEKKPEDDGEENKENKDEDNKEEEDDDKKKPTKNELEEGEKNYSVLEEKFNELTEKYASLEQQNAELLAVKNAVEDKEKDALIAQFYMLSDEDKKEVIENKSQYSLDDIEAKLSVICVRKKVNFENNGSEAEQNPAVTYNLDSVESDNLPAWLKAVENHNNRNN